MLAAHVRGALDSYSESVEQSVSHAQFKSPESCFPTRYCPALHLVRVEHCRFCDIVGACDSNCWPVVHVVRFVHAGAEVFVAGVDSY